MSTDPRIIDRRNRARDLLADFEHECARYGLPAHTPLEGLLQHVTSNAVHAAMLNAEIAGEVPASSRPASTPGADTSPVSIVGAAVPPATAAPTYPPIEGTTDRVMLHQLVPDWWLLPWENSPASMAEERRLVREWYRTLRRHLGIGGARACVVELLRIGWVGHRANDADARRERRGS